MRAALAIRSAAEALLFPGPHRRRHVLADSFHELIGFTSFTSIDPAPDLSSLRSDYGRERSRLVDTITVT